MQRHGVMNPCANASLRQVSLQIISFPAMHDVQVKDRAGPFWLIRNPDFLKASQERIVSGSVNTPVVIPVLQVRELDTKDTSLDGIKSAVVSFYLVKYFRLCP